MTAYAELQASSNFSFLRGASHPDKLVARAAELGRGAIAIADRNTLAGVVRAHVAAKAAGIKLVIGSRLDFADGTPSLLLFPTDRAAYGRLSRLLTLGKGRAAKGACALTLDDILEGEVFARGAGQMAITVPPRVPTPPLPRRSSDCVTPSDAGSLSPRSISVVATTPGGWRRSPISPRAIGSRWWPPTTCTRTSPNDGRSTMRSRASASTAPSSRRAFAWPPTPSGI